MAYLEKRANGWRAQVRRRGMPSISRTFDLKADAETWAREIEREAQRGNIAALDTTANRTCVADVLARYRKAVLPRSRNLGLPSLLDAIEKRFGTLFLANLRGSDVAKWRDDLLTDGYAEKTVHHHLMAMSAVFSFAEQELSIPLHAGNPVRVVRKPKGAKARDRRLRPGELEALLQAAEAPGTTVGLQQIIVLAIETSMRRSELVGLEWSRIDLERRIAHLAETKNGESRTVALSTTAVQALASLPRRPDGRVFAWKTASGFETIWQRCIKRARRSYLYDALRERLTAEGQDADSEVRALLFKKRKPLARTEALLPDGHPNSPTFGHLNSPTLAAAR